MSSNITFGGELMFPSDYIAAADLKGRDVTVTISKIEKADLQIKGGGKKRKFVLHIQERPDKKFVLNKTNGELIAGLYGPEARNWVGKRITLYPTKDRFGPKMVDCVRVRPNAPAQASRGTAPIRGARPEPGGLTQPPGNNNSDSVLRAAIRNLSPAKVLFQLSELAQQQMQLDGEAAAYAVSAYFEARGTSPDDADEETRLGCFDEIMAGSLPVSAVDGGAFSPSSGGGD